MLAEILAENPNDAFARYGLAMELSNQGKIEQAMEEFGKLLSAHPDYTAGYFMAAQTLAKADRVDEARKMLGRRHPVREANRQRARSVGNGRHARRPGVGHGLRGCLVGWLRHLQHRALDDSRKQLVNLHHRMHRPGHDDFPLLFPIAC